MKNKYLFIIFWSVICLFSGLVHYILIPFTVLLWISSNLLINKIQSKYEFSFDGENYMMSYIKFDYKNTPGYYLFMGGILCVLLFWGIIIKAINDFTLGFLLWWWVFSIAFWVGYIKEYKTLKTYHNEK